MRPWQIHILKVELVGELLLSLFRQLRSRRPRIRETVRAIYDIGVESLPMVGLAFAVVSFMMIVELSFQMKRVLQQDSLVPSFSTLLILRELGPVLAAVLIASRTGAGLAAQIATMKMSEQLDALKVCQIRWQELYLFPQWVACTVTTAMLSILGVACSILAGAIFAAVTLGYTRDEFMNTMLIFARWVDVLQCGSKGLWFGAIIPWTAFANGLSAEPTSSGVGQAATAAVVETLLWVIAVDFVLDAFVFS